MKILLVGGQSSLAQVLRPVLSVFADVLTAGRTGCDLELDLSWPIDRFALPVGVDAVVNLAAHFGGNDFDAMYAAEVVNALGSLKLAHMCAREGVRHLTQISSIFAGLDEDSPFHTAYALSKRHAEELTRFYCRRAGLPVAILRPAQIYGSGEMFRRHQPFLYAVMDKAQSGQEIVINGSNDAHRNFVHVDDLAEIIARVVRLEVEGQFNCSGPNNVRFSQIVTAAIAAFGTQCSVRFDTSKPDIPDNVFELDNTLYSQIGFSPRISMAQGLALEAERRRQLS